jgi:hypothetical protein
MKVESESKRNKIIVAGVILGAAAFGLLLVYFAFLNDSFSTNIRPFGTYASIQTAVFNGTEVSYTVQWNSPNYTPLYAQITSPNSDEANSPVCDMPAPDGQVYVLPFATTTPSTALSQVTLEIAVKSSTNSTQFSIEYELNQMTAAPGDLVPTSYSCSEPAGANM